MTEGLDENAEAAEQSHDEAAAPLTERLQAARRGSHLPGPTAAWVTTAVAVFVLAAGIAFGFTSSDGAASSDAITPPPPAAITPPPSQTPPVQAEEPPAVEEVEAPDEAEAVASPLLAGFQMPLDGACLTEFEGQLPNVPREYRNGIHEGVDFYTDFACLAIDHNTPVLAVKTGLVIRIDRDYAEMTAEEYAAAEAAGFQGVDVLDRFRGRQVWIDHGDSIVTRYGHLSAVAAGIEAGDVVRTGTVIAFVGESGTPESVFAPGADEHLHLEIRIGESYLGEGLPPLEARALYAEALGIVGP